MDIVDESDVLQELIEIYFPLDLENDLDETERWMAPVQEILRKHHLRSQIVIELTSPRTAKAIGYFHNEETPDGAIIDLVVLILKFYNEEYNKHRRDETFYHMIEQINKILDDESMLHRVILYPDTITLSSIS